MRKVENHGRNLFGLRVWDVLVKLERAIFTFRKTETSSGSDQIDPLIFRFGK